MKLTGPISYVLLGLILAASLYTGWVALQRQIYLSAPISATFEASVIVPDFVVGGDPQVQYDRRIHQSFLGSYRVEVKDATDGKTVCIGSGSNISYESGEPEPSDTSIRWYVGDDCALRVPPGQYYLETNYIISIEGYPDRYLTTKSNVFKIKLKTG